MQESITQPNKATGKNECFIYLIFNHHFLSLRNIFAILKPFPLKNQILQKYKRFKMGTGKG
jgi:hypothetical protein